MAKYVISDVHGDYNRFLKILQKIEFDSKDELYVLGDVIDRGAESYKIIDYIVGHKNIHLLKGNHEKLFQDFYETGDASLWYYNGGLSTHKDFLKQGYHVYDSIYRYVKNLPYIYVVEKYILTHAGVIFPDNYNNMSINDFIEAQDEDKCLWSRDMIHSSNKFKDYTIVCGHTPVQCIPTNNREENKIIKKDGIIYIDCGCGTDYKNKQLSCLRLDDLKEFYV